MRLRFVLALAACLMLQAGNYSGIGTVTTSGTPIAISTFSPAPPNSCISLTLTWVTTNSGTIYIGGTNVSAANKIGAYINSSFPSAYFAPAAGNAYVSPASIYVDAATSGDKVSYSCYR